MEKQYMVGINWVIVSIISSTVTPEVNAVFICNSNCGPAPCLIREDIDTKTHS